MTIINFDTLKIGIIGLGYVGLPLAVEFARHCDVIGFDISASRIDELMRGIDNTLEMASDELMAVPRLTFGHDADLLADCNVYIVTVPTPIDEYKKPDLTPLILASQTIGKYLKNGDVVIYESTVYPGATEEDCVPVLQATSGLKLNQDFFAGYSPERINPGDANRRLPDILKVTSGSNAQTADFVDALYGKIIRAGTFKAASIKVAEASKVIENTQRDVNIALINEISIICDRLGINTLDVLRAAETKWNFIPFRPGLVGGHCIGVDPYYLANKAQSVGYYPEVVLAGRRVNDTMAIYISNRVVREMIARDEKIKGSRVLILGATFKENCPDLRNSKVIDMVKELQSFGIMVDVADPWASSQSVEKLFGFPLVEAQARSYAVIIIAVAHDKYRNEGFNAIDSLGKQDALIFDLKGIFRNEPGLPHERIHTL